MKLSKSNIDILEDIISLKGDCLSSQRCRKCPFASQCLPDFLESDRRKRKLSKAKRFNLAISKIVNEVFFDSEKEKSRSKNG